MKGVAWWRGYERYWVTDALHEAGHAVMAALLGAVGIRIHLDPHDWENRGWTGFDFDPSADVPNGGWRVDLHGPAVFAPTSRDSDVPTRTWLVTRAGGVGGLIGCRALGIEVDVDFVMDNCEHDDRALERLLEVTAETETKRWIGLRYQEAWAMLLWQQDAVVEIARLALSHDWPAVEEKLARLADVAVDAPPLLQDDLAEASQIASKTGFDFWPDWRKHERRRFKDYKQHLH